jgi:hypothetical protein
MRSFAGFFTLFIFACVQRVTNAQIFPDGGCSICPSTLPVVGLPDVVLPAGTAGVVMQDQTCAETEAMAQSGTYTQAQCVLLRISSIPTVCGCEAGPDVPTLPPVETPTGSPVVAPTTIEAPTAAPIAVPVGAPTDSPVAVPVAVPTAAPTEAPVAVPVEAPVAVPTDAPLAVPVEVPVEAPTGAPVTGSVSIRLTSTTSALKGTSAETYLEVCSEFYMQHLSALNVSCDFSSRRFKSRRNLRALQANLTVSPIDVATDVTSVFAAGNEVDNYEQALINAVEQNSSQFISLLKTRGTALSQVFFETVQMVDAYSPTAVPPLPPVAAPVVAPAAAPVAAPTKDDGDDGLSGGAIAGIVVGVVGGIALLIAAVLNMPANPKPSDAPITSNVATDFAAPNAKPSTDVAPAPAAAMVAAATSSVAAASIQTTSVKDTDSNVKDGMSVLTGEMDAFSLDAGNVDQQSSVLGSKVDALSTQSGDEMSSHAMSSLKQNMISRTVIAPAGKLGIVIDTTLEGPVVHKVNPQSPLQGFLFPGDIIVGIDEVDTRAMSASAITSLMVRTANTRRKLHVLSEDVTS